METMTQASLLDALREAFAQPSGPDDARTTWELQKTMGLGDKAVRKRIRLAVEAGQIESVTVTRTSVHGKPVQVAAYRLKGSS
jgi:hypothetical protein